MVRFITLLLFILSIFLANAYAFDTSTDSGKTRKRDREQSQSQKKTMEQKGAFELEMSMDSVIIPEVLALEKKYLKSCSVISRPKLPRDFGMSTEISPGMYDTITGQILEQQAKSGAIVPNNQKLQEYKNCMALEGAIIAQSHITLSEILPNGSISFEDLKALAKIAVEKTIYQGINDQNIKGLYAIIKNDITPCRFNNSLNQFRCGISTIDLNNQQMYAGNVIVFGNKFYGYVGKYVVSQSSSKIKEYVASQKKAWELAKSGKQAVSPAKLIPGI